MKAELVRNLIRQLKAIVADLEAPENTLMMKVGGDWVTITDPGMAANALSAKWGGHWTLTHREERPIHGPYFTNFESKSNVAIARGKERFTKESFEAAMRDMNRITQEQREARQFNMHHYAEQIRFEDVLPRIFNIPPKTMKELGYPQGASGVAESCVQHDLHHPVVQNAPGVTDPVPTRPFTADSDVNTVKPKPNTVVRDGVNLIEADRLPSQCCDTCRLTPAKLYVSADGAVTICRQCLGVPMKR